MNSFISSDNTWMLWTFLVVWSAISIVLEQKYKWASKVTGAIIALLGAIIFANLKIIPTESSVYDSEVGIGYLVFVIQQNDGKTDNLNKFFEKYSLIDYAGGSGREESVIDGNKMYF